MKTLSIIIPAFNAEQTIDSCLESVLSQGLIDYEIIVVDDASTDRTLEIAECYKIRHDHIKILTHKKNKGPGEARNTALKNSDATYVFFLDSDDNLVKNSLSDLIKGAEESNADMVVFNYNIINPDGTLIKTTKFKNHFFTNAQKVLINILKEGSYGSGILCNKLYKKSIITKHHIKFPKRVYYEDMAFVFHYISVSKRILIYENTIYNYVQRTGSISNLIRSKNISDNQKIIRRIKRRLIKLNLFRKNRNEWNCFYIRRNCNYMISKIKQITEEDRLSDKILHKHLLSLNQRIITNNIEKLKADYLVYLGDYYHGNPPFHKKSYVKKRKRNFQQQPLVSYIMPVWNREDFLPEAIQSVLIQTYRNIELLIIDDASTDDSFQIMKDFAQKDHRIRIYRNENNQGNVKSRNILISESKGDLIAFIDSDDYIHPQKTELQVEFLQKNPHYGAVGSYAYLFSKSTKEICKSPEKYEDIFIGCFDQVPMIGGTMMISKSTMSKFNLSFDDQLVVAPDYYMTTQLVKFSKVANLPIPLYYYRIHEKSISGTKNELQIQTIFSARKQLLQFISGREINDKEQILFKRFLRFPSKFDGNLKILFQLIIDIKHNVKNLPTNYHFLNDKLNDKLINVIKKNRKRIRGNVGLRNQIDQLRFKPLTQLVIRLILFK